MTKKLILTLTLISLYGCQKDIDLKLENLESKLVINAQLTSDVYSSPYNGQNIIVSNSINPFDSYYNYILTEDSIPIINYAEISINNNQIEYKFEYNNDCYCYTNRDFKPIANETYTIEVKASDFQTVNAFDKIPLKTNFIISDFELLSDLSDDDESSLLKYDLCKLNINIQDNFNIPSFYKLEVKVGKPFENNRPNFLFSGQRQKGEKKCYFKSENPSLLNQENAKKIKDGYFEGKVAYFTDDLFNGQEENIFIEVDKPEGSWTYFYIIITSYSQNLYKYILNQRNSNNIDGNSMFNSEPVIFDSNINNGFGIFGSKSETKKTYLPLFYPTNGWLED